MKKESTWSCKCESCGRSFDVRATSEEKAIEAAKNEHERFNEEVRAFRCDLGPMMNHAFNLTHPEHPAAPRDW